MTLLDRRNILELIGSRTNKYHSCILTCYSIDFSFFEERVLPVLRSAHIKNINIFCDGQFVAQAQELTSGKEFKYNKSYNFYPIYAQGAFHPKIMLLTGKEQGLLFIGSGNITSSGISTNDEVWSAFHLNGLENDNAPIFGTAWQYLQPFVSGLPGFLSQKIEWIGQYSPWLQKLPLSDSWVGMNDIEIKFISNSKKVSTFRHIKESIDAIGKVESATIVSPYFDGDGEFLTHFLNELDMQRVHCLVDPYSGLLPFEIDQDTLSKCSFYNWGDCVDGFNQNQNRLHAKMINFITEHDELLYLGSANATAAGMGLINKAAPNEEVGLLLKRKKKKLTWFMELGIQLPSNTIEIHSFRHEYAFDTETRRPIHNKYRIVYSELNSDELEIYLNTPYDDGELRLLDRAGNSLVYDQMEVSGSVIKVAVRRPDLLFKVHIIDLENHHLSNYSLVHKLESLIKGNPDSRQEKLDALLSGDLHEGNDLSALLEFIDYNWADEADTTKESNAQNRSNARKDVEPIGKEYQVLSADEFNVESNTSARYFHEILSTPNVKIADFLRVYSSGLFNSQVDFEESEEHRLLVDLEQTGDGEALKPNGNVQFGTLKERNALIGFFKKLSKQFDWQNKALLDGGQLLDANKQEVALKHITAMLVAFELVLLSLGKQIERQEEKRPTKDAEPKPVIYTEPFFEIGKKNDSIDTLKGFLFNVYGAFLLLTCAGFKRYEYRILNKKMISNRQYLAAKALQLIISIPWNVNDKNERDLLIYNTLHFIQPNDDFSELHRLVNRRIESVESQTIRFRMSDQKTQLVDQYIPRYQVWAKKFGNKPDDRKNLIMASADLKEGDVIFNSRLGFNKIKSTKQLSNGFNLSLVRPGYYFRNGHFELENVTFGISVIGYK